MKLPLWLVVIAGMTITGCGPRGPRRAAVEGTVTLAARPLAHGRILFLPQPPAQGPVAAAVIHEGRFQLSRQEGPVVGMNRIDVEIERPLGFALDDEAAYARQRGRVHPAVLRATPPEEPMVEIKPGQTNRLDIALPGAGTAGAVSR